VDGDAWADPGVAMISPAGTGPTLGEQGVVVHIYIHSPDGFPAPFYPWQDLWIDDPGTGELSICPPAGCADDKTDENGVTTISGTMYGGGFIETGTQVFVGGEPCTTPLLPVGFRSPDIDGDLAVNTIDLGLFGDDFGHDDRFRSDFVPDGRINLLDLGVFGEHFGESCP
jgi:hypothetical protein